MQRRQIADTWKDAQRRAVDRGVHIASRFSLNYAATTEIYTLSLHDALPISPPASALPAQPLDLSLALSGAVAGARTMYAAGTRSEEHTSELQSRQYLVC